MELSVSPQVRLLALVGLLAALALAGGMMLLTRSQATAGAEDLSQAELTRALTPKPAKAKPAAPAKAKPAAHAKAKAAPAKEKPRPPVAANGVPTAIMDALRRSPAAVVALTASGAEIDGVTLAEARAAAAAAGVPYVEIDVLRPALGRAIARTLGVVEPPATLVYRRPGTVYLQLDGYADRDTIAQAAENARAAAG